MGFNMHHNFFSGHLEVVCGPMFSGKTEELIRRVTRAKIARQKVQIFKPIIDNRYDINNVVSHSSLRVEAIPVTSAAEILHHLHDSTRVVAIDEVQFFDDGIVALVDKLARRGHRVICAGLDQDFMGRPFGPMPELLALADDVTKIQAICTICGASATKTQRISASDDLIQVGEKDHYEARCRLHFEEISYREEINPYQTQMPLEMPHEHSLSH